MDIGLNWITNAWNNKIIWQHKTLINKTRNGENVPSLQVVEVVLVQCSLVDNQFNKSPKSYTVLLQINLMLVSKMLNQVI